MTTLVIHNAKHHGMYYTDLERRPIQLSARVTFNAFPAGRADCPAICR